MSNSDSPSQFADELVSAQTGLYAYILTLIPWPNEASDVLQQTNLTLWRDAAKFQPESNFRAWAYRVAYFQVLAHRSAKHRDRLRFDVTLLKELAEQLDRDASNIDDEVAALNHCMSKLTNDDRELICQRYKVGASVSSIAAALRQSPNSIAVRLHRVRRTLLQCVQGQLSRLDNG